MNVFLFFILSDENKKERKKERKYCICKMKYICFINLYFAGIFYFYGELYKKIMNYHTF
jgi:hypothetical protein